MNNIDLIHGELSLGQSSIHIIYNSKVTLEGSYYLILFCVCQLTLLCNKQPPKLMAWNNKNLLCIRILCIQKLDLLLWVNSANLCSQLIPGTRWSLMASLTCSVICRLSASDLQLSSMWLLWKSNLGSFMLWSEILKKKKKKKRGKVLVRKYFSNLCFC